MPEVVMYGTALCPYCARARMLLEDKGVAFKEIRVDLEPSLRGVMEQKSGQRTVPQIWVDDHHVGGFTDLWALDSRGKLDDLLD